jgi:ribokinase
VLDVVGFGAINLDEIYVVDSLSALAPDGRQLAPGSEEMIDATGYEELTRRLANSARSRDASGGGQAPNTAYALARMGLRTAVIGSVGADEEGEGLLAGLAPVDTSQVARVGRTPRCAVIVDKSGERTICVLPSPADAAAPDAVAAWQRLGGARCLHLTSLTHEQGLEGQVRLVETVSDDVILSFDPGELYCRLGQEALAPILRHTRVVFVGEHEAELLTGRAAPSACEELLELGPRIVVCKKGRDGVEVFAAEAEPFSLPAPDVAVVDPTGAGDVFAAGFLAGLLLGLDLRACATLGAEAAGRSLGGYGRTCYPGRELLDAVRAKGGLP